MNDEINANIAPKRLEEANEGNRRCGFCDARQDQVQDLIAGPGVYICDRCIAVQEARAFQVDLRGGDRRCSFCGQSNRPMALGATARICGECLRLSRDVLRRRRRSASTELR